MKKSVQSTLVLVAICAVMAVLLALTNSITAPIIKQNQEAAANEALLVVMPEGEGFEKMDLTTYELPATVTEVYKEANGGYVVTLTTAGYGSGFVIMCGVSADGTVTGAVCLSSTETLGYEKTYGEGFTGKDAAGVDAVDTISGATKTTNAYKNAVKDALNTAIILGGGSVDLRDEAQILNDNLSAALPAAEGKFTKLFIAEVIEGIDAVYTADNGKGSVYVVGEHFIPVDENGSIPAFSSVSPETLQNVAATDLLLKASTTEDVDLTPYADTLKYVTSAKKTATGNYIFETKGNGYGIKGGDEYHPASGEYIIVRVSMTPDGKIIDTFTVSQAESAGIGDACADEKFYGQFDGKTQSDYTDIDAISGATMTTEGYLKAIERAYEALNTLTNEGGSANE